MYYLINYGLEVVAKGFDFDKLMDKVERAMESKGLHLFVVTAEELELAKESRKAHDARVDAKLGR